MNLVSMSPTRTGTVSRCARYWKGTVEVTVEKVVEGRVRSK
jgi:hypothetical protein